MTKKIFNSAAAILVILFINHKLCGQDTPAPVEAENIMPATEANTSNEEVSAQSQADETEIDTKSVFEKENDIRVKQMDEAIETALHLDEFFSKINAVFEEYNTTVRTIDKDNSVLNEILSKYRPMIEQILRYNSILAEREKHLKFGEIPPDVLTKHRRKLEGVLKKIDSVLKVSDTDFDQIGRDKIEGILKEIDSVLNEQTAETKEITVAENEEQLVKALSIIRELSDEIQKSIIKDSNILNFIDQKREELKKLAWIKAQKSINELVEQIKKVTTESADKLKPLTSENVEHLIIRANEKSANLRNYAARKIWQFAESSYSQKRFSEAKDRWELSRKIYAETIKDISRLQEKINIESPRLDKIKKHNQATIDLIITFEEKCEKEIAVAQFRDKISLENIDSGRQLRLNDIDVHIAKAEVFIKNQDYMQARDALETVLMRDPYNIKATRMLKLLYEKLFDIAKVRRYNEYLETLSINEWNWNEAVLPRPADKPVLETKTKQVDRTSIASKLNEIVIPRIEFEDTTIKSAVEWLTNESKEHDTTPQRNGVPIMLQLSQEQVAQIPPVNLIMDDVPMGEIIRYLCQSTGLKYRVEDRAVIISSQIQDVMETRFFKVRAQVISSIAPAVTEEAPQFGQDMLDLAGTFGGTGGGTGTGTGTRPTSVSSEQLKTYFTERGVPFTDPDATIAYDRRSGKLVAKNTPENLRRLETLLREIDIETPLVLIETKFVEITQNDLEELGFEYLFSKAPNVPVGQQTPTSSWWQITQNASTMRTLGVNQSGIASPVNAAVDSRLINNLQFPAFGRRGDAKRYNLTFFLHAIDRNQSVEVLSAPKVIATSGTEAVIRMVREEYYPDSWSEPEITVTDNVFRVIPSIPEFGEPTDVGIRLNVTPTVSPNNYTINLQLNPQILERTGWTDYSYNIISDGNITRGTLIMRELSRRDVQTNVKVFDGETLIIGGMIRDDVSAVDDRIPGLGDLPIVGRLARTTNHSNTKRNLIIFITARLVNPDGIPIRAGKMRGLFDFRR